MSQSDQEHIQPPGTEAEMTPQADHGEASYKGCDKLVGRVAVITGGDSGIGRAVAIAYAREGADILISYLNEQEDEDARETARHVEAAGRRCVLVPGDIAEAAHCRTIIDRAVSEFGRIDILVNNAAFQRTYENLEDIPDEEWSYTFRTNIEAMFHLAKAAVPHMRPGSSIINTTSIQSDKPSPMLLAYASTKGAVSNFTAGLAQMLGRKGIRVNAVAPGPIWTPLIPSTFSAEEVKQFGAKTPMKRPGQPNEVAPAYLFLACEDSSYVSGSVLHPNGGEATEA
jgi:NAD(P)-dependent dehydrogenase (short-subunit alcohol dehydrogenase family)